MTIQSCFRKKIDFCELGSPRCLPDQDASKRRTTTHYRKSVDAKIGSDWFFLVVERSCCWWWHNL